MDIRSFRILLACLTGLWIIGLFALGLGFSPGPADPAFSSEHQTYGLPLPWILLDRQQPDIRVEGVIYWRLLLDCLCLFPLSLHAALWTIGLARRWIRRRFLRVLLLQERAKGEGIAFQWMLRLRTRLTLLWMLEFLILGIGISPWGGIASGPHQEEWSGVPFPWIDLDWQYDRVNIAGFSLPGFVLTILCVYPLAVRAARLTMRIRSRRR